MRSFLVAGIVLGLIGPALSSPRDTVAGANHMPTSSPLHVIPYRYQGVFEGRAAHETNGPARVRPYHLDDVPPIASGFRHRSVEPISGS
jgi:hypothetical protein